MAGVPHQVPGRTRRARSGASALAQLYDLARKRKKLTLVFSSRNLEHNNAVVLKELLDGMRKPPHSSGPEKAAGGAVRARRSVK